MENKYAIAQKDIIEFIKKTQNKPYKITKEVRELRDRVYIKSGYILLYPLDRLNNDISILNKESEVKRNDLNDICDNLFI